MDESNWAEGFAIGSVVEGEVQEVKDIGVTISFEKYHDVFGFIALHGCKFYRIIFMVKIPFWFLYFENVFSFSPCTLSKS